MTNKLTISYKDGGKITLELENNIDKILKSLENNIIEKSYSREYVLEKDDEKLFHRERTGIEIKIEE